MEKTRKYLEAQVASKRSELEAANKEADELLKKNEATEDEKELEEIGEEAKALQEKIAQLKEELAEAEAALAELEEKPAEETPKAEEKPMEMEEPKQRSLRQITEKRGINIMENKQIEERAANFVESNKMEFDTAEQRSVLISSGNIATPTGVGGINDGFNTVSSIVDMVTVEDCEGMGSYKIAYEDTDATAADKTEGQAAGGTGSAYKHVELIPKTVAVIDYISKEVQKQSPLNYTAKVEKAALNALRKKAGRDIIANIYASQLNATKAGTVSSGKVGVIDDKTLRNIALAYGGDENVMGSAVLFLNKTDLIAFGDVRGTQDKKPVYEITPDTNNPNTGIIKDGGLSVKYCINSGCNAFSGAAQTTTAKSTMIYGNPKNFVLGLFDKYTVETSRDYKFAEGLLSVLGDTMYDGKVAVKHGFVVYQLPATAQ